MKKEKLSKEEIRKHKNEASRRWREKQKANKDKSQNIIIENAIGEKKDEVKMQ